MAKMIIFRHFCLSLTKSIKAADLLTSKIIEDFTERRYNGNTTNLENGKNSQHLTPCQRHQSGCVELTFFNGIILQRKAQEQIKGKN